MWNLKYDANESVYQTDPQTQSRLMAVGRVEVGRVGWIGSLGLSDANYDTITYRMINNEGLLNSIGN